MSEFEIALNYVLGNEGGLVDNPKDPGGITKYGISLRFLSSLSINQTITRDDIENLTLDHAKDIYLKEFWHQSPFDQIANQDICNRIFDMAINMGIAPAIKCAQRALWAVYQNRNIIADDGILGNNTIYHLNKAPYSMLAPAISSERGGDYRVIVTKSPEKQEFLNGWLNRAYNIKE